MTRKLRISHLIVQPVLVWDDGDDFTPGPEAAPKQISTLETAGLRDRLRAEVAALQAQLEAAEPTGPEGSQEPSQQ